MKRIIRLTESDITRIVKRVIKENNETLPLGVKLITPQGIGTDLQFAIKEITKESLNYND